MKARSILSVAGGTLILAAVLLFLGGSFDGCQGNSEEDSERLIDSLSQDNAFLRGQNSSLLSERPLLLSMRDTLRELIASEIRGLKTAERSYRAPKVTPIKDSSAALAFLKQEARRIP